ncbi:MAG: ABC transporter permease [Puniceicoccales bacterium]|jgi:lipoprotein-releasing system permease protein|nr:ABC transporter permease [Puniceicoccales bacterium]
MSGYLDTDMPWYFYLAFRNLFPFRKIVSFFSVVSVIGVAIGVAVLIVVQSVMNGYNNQTKSNIINTQGEIRVECSSVINEPEALEKFFLDDGSMTTVSPYVSISKGHQSRERMPGLDSK